MANRYFVGADGADWNSTTSWSDTEGGASGSSVPTSSDDVYIKIFNTDLNITINISSANADCNNLILTRETSSSYTYLTLNQTNGYVLNVYGNLSSTLKEFKVNTIYFKATSTGKTITLDGSLSKGFYFTNTYFDGVGGEWSLVESSTGAYIFYLGNLTITNGSFISNGQKVSIDTLNSSNSNTRGINFDNSTITITNEYTASTTVYDLTNTTNLTFSASTSNIYFDLSVAGSGIDATLMLGALTYDYVRIYAKALSSSSNYRSSIKIDKGNIFNRLNVAVFTATGYEYSPIMLTVLGSNPTLTATTLTLDGSAAYRIFIRPQYVNHKLTIDSDTVTLDCVDFRDTIATGSTLPFTGTRLGDCHGNTDITFDAPATHTWISQSGNFSDSSNWDTGIIPIPQDVAIFNASSFTQTSSIYISQWNFPSIQSTGTLSKDTYLASYSTGDFFFNGDFDIYSFKNIVSTIKNILLNIKDTNNIIRFNPNTTYNYGSIYIFAKNGKYTLNSSIKLGNSSSYPSCMIYHYYGDFDANGYDIQASGFYSNYASSGTDYVASVHMGEGTWTIGRVFMIESSYVTLYKETSTLKINAANGIPRFISLKRGANITELYNVWITGASTSTLYFNGNIRFNSITDDNTSAHTLRFSKDHTFYFNSWGVKGNSSRTITINSCYESSGSYYTSTDTHALVYEGAGTIQTDYLNIQHSVATPSDTWYCGPHEVNNQSVTTAGSGWIFPERFTNPENAYTDDSNYATVLSDTGDINVSLSWDDRVTWTSVLTKTFTGSETTETYGAGDTELWGRSWLGSEVTDANFRVKLTCGTNDEIRSIYKTFGFSITPTYNLTGIKVQVKAYWDGTTMHINHVKVTITYGTSVLPIQAGSMTFASNGRKVGETAGNGTGVLVFFDGNKWVASDSGALVQA